LNPRAIEPLISAIFPKPFSADNRPRMYKGFVPELTNLLCARSLNPRFEGARLQPRRKALKMT
jgi:hypothetical protein